jgi:hypothetical protein
MEYDAIAIKTGSQRWLGRTSSVKPGSSFLTIRVRQQSQYATYIARIPSREGDASVWQEVRRLAAWANLWYGWSGSAFVRAYLATADAGAFLPHTREDLLVLLENFLLATVVADLSETLDTRPRWAWVAIEGLLQLLEAYSSLSQGERERVHTHSLHGRFG